MDAALNVLMNRMGRTLGQSDDTSLGPITESERACLVADIDQTREDVPKMLLVMAANVLVTLGDESDRDDSEALALDRETLERLATEQGDTRPDEMAAKLARLVTRILDRRTARPVANAGA